MRGIPVLAAALSLAVMGACADRDRTADTDRAVGQRVVVDGGAYMDIDVSELQSMLANKDFPLVNVHIPFEGNLPGTDVSIPFDQITRHLDQLPADRNARIVLYCKTGRMSREAAEALVELGYGNVYNLSGGFTAWRAAGLPMDGG